MQKWTHGSAPALTALALALFACAAARSDDASVGVWRAERLPNNPIVTPSTHPSIGHNINGPSIIKVPNWVKNPMGQYYLYFADHNGKFIRLAYAQKPEGPFTVHPAGVLPLAQSHFTDHIASPDVIIDEDNKRIRMYYHGLTPEERSQHTRVAISEDGLNFTAQKEPVGRGSAYWRVFRHRDWWYALAMPGTLLRSKDGLTAFEKGPQMVPAAQRMVHCGVLLERGVLHIFYTRAGDTPERIVHSSVALIDDWLAWKLSAPAELLKPEREWEGATLPIEPGRIGAVEKPIHALRDPAVLLEPDRVLLYYAIAGESGIGVAHLLRR